MTEHVKIEKANGILTLTLAKKVPAGAVQIQVA